MTDARLRTIFYTAVRNGRRAPAEAKLEIERYDECTRVVVKLETRGRLSRWAHIVPYLAPIRRASDPPERPAEEIEASIRAAVVALAYCCIDAVEARVA